MRVETVWEQKKPWASIFVAAAIFKVNSLPAANRSGGEKGEGWQRGGHPVSSTGPMAGWSRHWRTGWCGKRVFFPVGIRVRGPWRVRNLCPQCPVGPRGSLWAVEALKSKWREIYEMSASQLFHKHLPAATHTPSTYYGNIINPWEM